MKKSRFILLAFLLALFLMIFGNAAAGFATDTTEDPVQAVIAQLEAIDTLQQMRDKRSQYSVKNNHYDVTTTNSAIIEEHTTARTEYEAYVAKMEAARLAAQQAYDALSSEQKAQIDSSLSGKLGGELSTVFKGGTFSVTPGEDAYVFEAVNGGAGYAYEVSNYMISGQIPQTFILVDTSDGNTSWTPSGKYEQGESNYEVTYCCDVETGLEYSSKYKRVNLEDSGYYGANAAAHIRAILENAYPFVSMNEMKSWLKSGGLNSTFVDSLTRSDLISGVQGAIWSYANDPDTAMQYFASINITKNTGIYFTPLHDTNNEASEWLPGKRQRTFDERAQYRVNTLVSYLIGLDGKYPDNDEIVISDVKVTRAELLPDSDNTYQVGMYVHLNNGGSENDNLKVVVASSSTGGKTHQNVDGRTKIPMTIKAHPGDTITVTVEGTQHLDKGVYFYEPEGGRNSSQSLVGVAEGETPVHAEAEFAFDEEIIEMGLRIYKSESGTGLPLKGITFDVYKVPEGGTVSPTPTDEEIQAYKTAENKVAAVTTDETGYAALTLENGYYLIVEEHNSKIKAPVHPFYISVPMSTIVESDDGTTSAMVNNIVSVYPKNETVTPPEEPPVTPPIPDDTLKGNLQVIKHSAVDSSLLLPGAEFNLYRPATEDDTDTEIITCDGVQYAVVLVDTLTTGQDGTATKGDLPCGLYFLKEITAPAGYNLLDEAVSVTVVSSDISEVTTIRIANEPGYALPETGAAGTTWFYLAGGVLTLLTAALLISKKRMSAI